MNRLCLSFIMLLCWLLCFPAWAVEGDDEQQAAPLEVTAQQLDADQSQRQATFSGTVVATQGDIALYCEKLVVYSLPEQDQIERLEAFGKVRVVQLDRVATADHAVYRQQQGTLSLFGNARVHQGKTEVTGSEIVLYLQENRSLVKSGDGSRVKAVFFPEQKQE